MKIWQAGTGCMAVAALALLATPPMAAAESYFNVKAGAYIPTEDMDSGFSGELEFGYDFLPDSRILAVDVSIGYSNPSEEVSGYGITVSGDYDVVPIAVGVTGGVESGPWRVYGGAGLDLVFFNADVTARYGRLSGSVSDDDTVFGAHIKGGATYNLSNKMFVGAEAKYLFADDVSLDVDGVSLSGDISGFSIMALIGFRW